MIRSLFTVFFLLHHFHYGLITAGLILMQELNVFK